MDYEERELLQQACNACPTLRARVAELEAALKLAVEALEKITGGVTSDGKSYGSSHCDVVACQRRATDTLRAIAEKLGVKG